MDLWFPFFLFFFFFFFHRYIFSAALLLAHLILTAASLCSGAGGGKVAARARFLPSVFLFCPFFSGLFSLLGVSFLSQLTHTRKQYKPMPKELPSDSPAALEEGGLSASAPRREVSGPQLMEVPLEDEAEVMS